MGTPITSQLVPKTSNKYFLCSALNTCAKTLNWGFGLQIHAKIVKNGYEENVILGTTLVDFYGKCGALVDARRVFDAVKGKGRVFWTCMITGYSQNGDGIECVMLFKKMLVSGVRPNGITYVGVIGACRGVDGWIDQGRSVHGHVVKLGMDGDTYVVSTLVDCYSKFGNVDDAFKVFDAMKDRDVVLYISMISGCANNFKYDEALRLFARMRRENLGVSDHSLSSVLKACGSLALLQEGKQLHGLLVKAGSVGNVFVVSALIDMYSNCGRVYEARGVFDCTVRRNTVLWTSMVSGYAQSGRVLEGLELFDCLLMEEELELDHVCFTAILSACNHAGFLDRGVQYFEKMTKDYGLVPRLDHYACLVDLYARKGNLREAKQIMQDMPYAPHDVMLSSFLGFCKIYGEVELARETFDLLLRMKPHNAAACLIMIQIYAEAGLWDEVAEIRKLLKQQENSKKAAWSWVEVDKGNELLSVVDASFS